MLSARATDGYRDVASVVAVQHVQPVSQKLFNVRSHQSHVRLQVQKISHWLVQSREIPKGRLIVRVGQHAHVEDVVGIHGNAAFERKGLEHQGQLPLRRGHQTFDITLQLGGADGAGVDHVRLFAQLGQQLPLQLNDLDQRPAPLLKIVVRQGMAAARFGETPHKGVNRGVQKKGLHGHALAAQTAQFLRHLVQRGGAADIHRNGYAVAMVFVFQRYEGWQQFGWQVVYAVVASIFQCVQSDGFSRS